MTDHTTHDLAIARAERDAWQSTCEELHRTIAGRDVEIEAHLGRIEAADQRAIDAVANAQAEKERTDAINQAVDGKPSDASVRLNCERMRKSGKDTSRIAACAGPGR